MQNNITPFGYDDKLIRVIEDEKTGEPLWVAKDVCGALCLDNVNRAVSKLDDDEKLKLKVLTSGQNRDTLCINESGLYTLILRSNKPEAKKFKKWVTSEVLPTIRKTGSYSVESKSEDIAPVLETMVKLMHMILENQMEQKKEIQELKETQAVQMQQIAKPMRTNTTISAKQMDKLNSAIRNAAVHVAKFHKLTTVTATRVLYGELNGRMGVSTYYQILEKDFLRAMIFIKSTGEKARLENENINQILEDASCKILDEYEEDSLYDDPMEDE